VRNLLFQPPTLPVASLAALDANGAHAAHIVQKLVDRQLGKVPSEEAGSTKTASMNL